jgi:hypothetical protein
MHSVNLQHWHGHHDSLGGVLHVKGEEAESARLLRKSAAMFRRLRDGLGGAYVDHPNMAMASQLGMV